MVIADSGVPGGNAGLEKRGEGLISCVEEQVILVCLEFEYPTIIRTLGATPGVEIDGGCIVLKR